MHNLYLALTKRMEFLGLPYVYFFAFAGIAYVVTILFMKPILNLVLIPFYIIGRILHKRDPFFIEIVIERFAYKSKYDA